MGRDLDERPVAGVDQPVDAGSEEHRLADGPPPVLGVEVVAGNPVAGHDRRHRDGDGPGTEVGEGGEDVVPEAVHVGAVVGHRHLQRNGRTPGAG